MPLGDRRGDREREERADEVQARREADRQRGGIARVEIEVAIALAVSWKPFVKSKASAVPTTIQRTTSVHALAVLDHHAFEDVGRSLRGVDGLLETLEDVLPADDHHRVDPCVEQ